MMRIKIDKRDKLFSLLVRGRNEWKCEHENCSKTFHEGDRRGLECAHIVTRSRKATRWHPQNALSLCTGHHMYFTGRPLEFSEWIIDMNGKEDTDYIQTLSRTVGKYSKPELEDLHQRLKEELKIMEEARSDGVAGYLHFQSPYEERNDN